MNPRPPLPPFAEETASQKVQAAEDAWNSRDPVRVSLAYTEDTEWRNRAEFVNGRAQVVEFLRRKWEANEKEIKSAADFIVKAGTGSSTSGKPYLIRINGVDIPCADYLTAQVKKLGPPAAGK